MVRARHPTDWVQAIEQPQGVFGNRLRWRRKSEQLRFDWHGRILQFMGIDHQRVTYHDSACDFRLTEIYGRVVHDVLEWLRFPIVEV